MNESSPMNSRPAMRIKGLSPALPERGKIKIGERGEVRKAKNGNDYQLPMKLDHFKITTLEVGKDGNFNVDEVAHKTLGEKPTEIPVTLIYDDPDLNFPSRYASYDGRKLYCSGDGENAQRLNDDGKGHKTVACTCPLQDPAYTGARKCKMNGSLSVLINGVSGVGGVYKFRTTSYNTIVGILSTMSFLRTLTGGPLAGIPLKLVVRPKQATAPDGKQQTIYVVGLEYAGDMSDLQKKGHAVALERAKTHLSIEYIENEARRQMREAGPDAPLPGDDNDQVVGEFYHEEAMRADGTVPDKPTRGDFQQKGDANVTETFSLVDEVGEVIGEYAADDYTKEIDDRLETLTAQGNLSAAKQLLENNVDELTRAGAADFLGDKSKMVLDAMQRAEEAKAAAKKPTPAATKPAQQQKQPETQPEPQEEGIPEEGGIPGDDQAAEPKAPYTLDAPRASQSWQWWVSTLVKEMQTNAKTPAQADGWWSVNKIVVAQLQKADAVQYNVLVTEAKVIKKRLQDAA